MEVVVESSSHCILEVNILKKVDLKLFFFLLKDCDEVGVSIIHKTI